MTTRELIDVVGQAVAPLKRRVMLMVARGKVKRVYATGKRLMAQVELGADNVPDQVECFQQYGIASTPPIDAEALHLSVAGSRGHGIVPVIDDKRYRPTTLANGEVALYTLQNGIRVLCKADGTVLVGTTPTDYVALATPTKSEISSLRNTVDALVTAFNAHVHPYTDTPVGPSFTLAIAVPASAPAAVGDVKATEVKAK